MGRVTEESCRSRTTEYKTVYRTRCAAERGTPFQKAWRVFCFSGGFYRRNL